MEIEGLPVRIKTVREGRLTFAMPTDLWDRPARSAVSLRLFNGRGWSKPIQIAVQWPQDDAPRITAISPNPAQVTESVTIIGTNLTGSDTQILFDNRPVTILLSAPDKVVVRLPDGILTPLHYNVLVRRENKSSKDQGKLAPGESTTVVGFIRVKTPGDHEFRVGLVASGFRFVDDNAFRTKIIVLP